jgi:hypothetical protein
MYCESGRVQDLAEKMEHTQFLRNRLGAHFSDWGEGLSDQEARDSAENVIALWQEFLCPRCGRVGAASRRKQNKKWTIKFRCCST